jgi:two-component system, NarL family, response regulator DesR
VNEAHIQSEEEAPVADRTNLPALALTGPLQDVDLVEPEPSVAVVAGSPLLRRRIGAVLDFDRLPVVAQAETPAEIDTGGRPTTVAVLAAEDADAALSRLQTVRRELPDARAVLVLERVRRGPLRRALRAGASAAVEATQVETGLALAVRAASAGLVVVPEAMRDRLEPPALSPREREVLALAAEGSTTGEIATRMTVSLGTVKRHLSSCFAKLGVENRSEALALLLDTDRDPAALVVE